MFSGEYQDFDLAGDNEGAYGTCVVDEREVTCEMSDVVEGKTGVHGDFWFEIKAVANTEEESVEFEIPGGEPIEVALPGNGGGIGTISPLPTVIEKKGALGSDNRTVTWTVDLPGSFLEANFAGSDTATFTDTPSDPQQLVPNSGGIKYYEQTPQGLSGLIALADGEVTLGEPDENNSFQLTVDAGEDWDPSKVYQVTYQTKTTGLVSEGTKFTNTFGVAGEEGIVGDAGGPTWKTGRSDSSYQELDWTVLAPGAEAVDGVLTISDSVSAGPHEFIADDLNLEVKLVGRGAEEVDYTVEVDEPNGMTVTIDNVTEGNEIYELTYHTHYTGTVTHPEGQLPESGTLFENTALIGDETVKGTVTTGRFASSKSGALNSEAKTLNGVEHPKNTMLDWNITISGNQLQNAESLTVTDTLGETHQVCEGSGTLENRLGVNFTVKDKTNGQPVTDHGVELSVAQGATDREIEYTLNQTNGDAWNRSHEYVITYSTCTTSGGQDPWDTAYTNSVSGESVSLNETVTLQRSAGGTGTGVNSGSFDLEKDVVSGSVSAGAEFTVLVEEFSSREAYEAGGVPEESYQVTVGDGQSVSGN